MRHRGRGLRMRGKEECSPTRAKRAVQRKRQPPPGPITFAAASSWAEPMTWVQTVTISATMDNSDGGTRCCAACYYEGGYT